MRVMGGNFGENRDCVFERSFSGKLVAVLIPTTLFGRPHRIAVDQLEGIEVVNEQNASAVGRSLGMAAVGALIGGGFGAVVGGIAGSGSKTSLLLLVTVQNRGQFLASATQTEFTELMAAKMRPAGTVKPTPAWLNYASLGLVFAALAALVFAFIASK